MKIPKNITLLFKYLEASMTIQPIPEVEATISAATNVENETPIAVLIPVNISGKAPGKITHLKIDHLPAPKDFALKT